MGKLGFTHITCLHRDSPTRRLCCASAIDPAPELASFEARTCHLTLSPSDRQEDRQRVMGYIEEINELLVSRHTEEPVVLDDPNRIDLLTLRNDILGQAR